MKNKLYLGIVAISFNAIAQQNPTGSPPANNTNAQASAAWYRGGNNLIGNSNNIFGTMWNSPVYHFTSGVQRMVLNGNLTVPTTAAAGTQNTSGFLGINTNNPWSRVHIAAPGASLYGGYRGWMREGLTLQENNDQLWFGHKKWGANPDQFNAIINWGDDQGVNFNGPDHLVFNFTSSTFSGAFPAPGVTPNAQTDAGMELVP